VSKLRTPAMKPITVAQAAYIAGILDGEGTITISRKRGNTAKAGKRRVFYRPFVQVCLTTPNVLTWLVEVTGLGHVATNKSARTSRQKPSWRWSLWSNQARQLLEATLPYLIIKKTQAELLIEFCKKKRDNVGRNGLSDAEWAFQVCVHRTIALLNQRGIKDMENMILFHEKCTDGFTAAWAAWRAFGNTATYTPCQYGGEVPDVTGQNVYIVDFSFKPEVLLDMAAKAKSVVLLDHHKTAEADLKDLQAPGLEIHFDMKRSGAKMTWDYFFPNQDNWLVDYVQDRDLWTFNLPESKTVNAYLGALPYDFALFNKVFEEGSEKANLSGQGCLTWVRYYVESTKALARECWFLGRLVPVVNCPYTAVSEIVGELSEGHSFAVGWHQKEDGQVVYSLRSRHGFDVSALAKTMGGGGHAAAAGFTVPQFPWEIAYEGTPVSKS
jgi:hypothetical protein